MHGLKHDIICACVKGNKTPCQNDGNLLQLRLLLCISKFVGIVTILESSKILPEKLDLFCYRKNVYYFTDNRES